MADLPITISDTGCNHDAPPSTQLMSSIFVYGVTVPVIVLDASTTWQRSARSSPAILGSVGLIVQQETVKGELACPGMIIVKIL